MSPAAGALGVTEAERLARAGLCQVAEPGDLRVHRRIDRAGAVALWAVLRDTHPDVDPAADLERLDRLGGRLVCPGDEEWPSQLDELRADADPRSRDAGPPYALWLRGPLPLRPTAERSVALVGSRAATPYGVTAASRLGADLADRGWAVVSGAAYGIDAAAHRGAIAAAGPTVAVLAGGVDVPYPTGNTDLLHRIGREGLVVSEVPPGQRPLRHRFLVRNRLIAALATGTVIVEAGVRSGALNTGRHARRLGRPLMAVPGPVTSPLSSGCHLLLREFREEAALVTSAVDVVEEVGPLGALAEPPRGPVGPRDHLSAAALRVLDVVPPRRAAGLATVASRVRQPLTAVLAVLGPLVAEGLVEQLPDGYRLTALGRAPSAEPVPTGGGP